MESNIVKSANDRSSYKALTLENGLKVLLVSDTRDSLEDTDSESETEECEAPECDEDVMDVDEESPGDQKKSSPEKKKKNLSAAALSVGIGSFSDPPELPGLAHFLEHMVFMGSKKYPKENAYDDFIKTHGGEDNAFTSSQRTVFLMDVVAKHFYGALDIFAHCLIEPLLRYESMDREVRAVDSEFALASPSDTNRIYLLRQTMAKEGHPFSKFPWGNLKSLKEDPAEKNIDLNAAVKEFYQRNYSSHNMTLAVQSTATLETLEQWVREIFAPLKNNNVPRPAFEPSLEPFKMEKFHQLYKVVSIKDTHELNILWVMPPSVKYYRSKPLQYISHLVGHEGKGSLLSWLRKKSYAVSLLASDEFSDEDVSICSLFSIKITLSGKGMDNIYEVCTGIFQYIQMLRKEAPKKYIFDEIQSISEKDFRFEEKEEPFDYVTELAGNMHIFPPEHYITGDKLYYDYDENAIKEFLACMDIAKSNITILSSRYTKDTMPCEEEPWTKCNYSCSDIPAEYMEKWSNLEDSPEFHLPEPNKFIATSFDLIHKESKNKYPIRIVDNEQGCLWFKEDAKFKVPKAFIYLYFVGSQFIKNEINVTMLDLFLEILKQKLPDYVYAAQVASLDYTIESASKGFGIKVYGFNEKLPMFLETILEVLCTLNIEEEFFDNLKRHLRNKYNNQILKLSKLSGCLEKLVLQNIYWSPMDKFKVIDSITLEQLTAFTKSSFTDVFVEGLIQGNISKEDAASVFDMVQEKMQLMPLASDKLPKIETMKVPFGQTVCRVASFNKVDNNSAMINYYQICAKDIESLSLMDLLMWNMTEPCFDTLRTNQQLGYYVFCAKFDLRSVLGFVVSIQFQSSKFSCGHVDKCIDDFLKGFVEEMNVLSDEVFLTQLNSLIEKKKVDLLNLREEVELNWGQILGNEYTFDEKEKQIEFLQNLTKEQYQKFWNEKLSNITENCKKLSIQVVGPDEELSNCEYTEGDKTPDTNVVESDGRSETVMVRKKLRFIGKPCEALASVEDIRTFKKSLASFLDKTETR